MDSRAAQALFRHAASLANRTALSGPAFGNDTMTMGRRLAAAAALGVLGILAGCGKHVGPPEMQSAPVMVDDAGAPRLWVLTKREESEQVNVGGSSRATSTRTDTLFHFDLLAFDPVTVRPLWNKRLLTLGDPEARGKRVSQVIGSSANGRFLGQDGALVWMLLNEQPVALNAADGSVVVDTAGIEQRNPALKGMMPREAGHYGFDRGLVFLSADAQRYVLGGPELQAKPYTPAAAQAPEAPRRSNGKPRVVPTRPSGEVPARQAWLAGKWLGLYSEKEAADAAEDTWGDKLLFPYSVHDEGALARRVFWRANIVGTQRFDEVYDRLSDLTPVPGSPTFLKGRFLKNLATGDPLVLKDPDGLLVWHSTRIDSEGRLALARLDTGLKTVWTAALPLSENSTSNPVGYLRLPGRIVVTGTLETVVDGVHHRSPHLVSLQLSDGAWQGWNIEQEAADH